MGWLKFAACLLLAGLVTAHYANHRRIPVDAFRMLRSFPHSVAMSSSSNDTRFKCLTGSLTRYNQREKKATYVWHLKARGGNPARNITFDITGTDVPDQVTYVVDNDPTHPLTAYYNYTDYRNCMVTIVPYDNHDHCLLWVKPSIVHRIPRNCIVAHEENCDVRNPLFEENFCGDVQ